jgi:NADH dehydrogenase FAD-containing subunit
LKYWGKKAVKYHEGVVTNIDTDKQTVTFKTLVDGKTMEMKYDKLVLGVGSSQNTSVVKGASENTLPLKDLHDAKALRKRILDAFESASLSGQTDQVSGMNLVFANNNSLGNNEKTPLRGCWL